MLHKVEEAPRVRLPDGFLSEDHADLERSPELIRDTIPRNGTGVLIGQSGSGKTFLAVHQAHCLAAKLPFFGREVAARVGCVHLAYENGGTIKHRYRAANLHTNADRHLPLAYASRTGNLFQATHLKETIRDLIQCGKWFEAEYDVKLGFATIDTASTAFVMQDENSNAEIAKVCKVLAKIADETGAFTQAVHHMGKDPKAGARGGSAWRANVDSMILCLADRNPLTGECSNHRLVVDKHRDGPEGPVGAFELAGVEIGKEKDGKPFSSLAVRFLGEKRAPAERVLTRNQQSMFDLLIEAGPKGLPTEEWHGQARDIGLGIKRKADLFDIRRTLQRRGLIFKGEAGWFAKR